MTPSNLIRYINNKEIFVNLFYNMKRDWSSVLLAKTYQSSTRQCKPRKPRTLSTNKPTKIVL